VAVVVEPDRRRLTRELLTDAARLAFELGGSVAVLGPPDAVGDPDELASWGADELVVLEGAAVEEDAARAVRAWAETRSPWAILTGSTAWGREVAARLAAALGAGLTGDAVGLGCENARLVAWKPAFGGQLVAAIRSDSPIQMATVRAGVVRPYRPRTRPASRSVTPAPSVSTLPMTTVAVEPRRRVQVRSRVREDNVGDLLQADAVLGLGRGVDPAHYGDLEDLLAVLGAELGATRKVTDNGWMTHARQIGITGHSIAPRLFVAVGSSGSFNHMVGVRSAGTILAVNPDPEALVFDVSDVGIVGDWRDVVPALVDELRLAQSAAGDPG
jgi:electron transfer flavoprotein alpha subunit